MVSHFKRLARYQWGDKISACIQRISDLEPIWLEGMVSISRSPVAHPGDGRFIMFFLFPDITNDT